MTQERMAEIMAHIHAEEQRLRDAGQKEYAHDPDNAFRNFEKVGENLRLPREQVLLVYLQKHLDGIFAHVQGHTSQRENVAGRILDAKVYLTLLYGMFVEDGVIGIPIPQRRLSDQMPQYGMGIAMAAEQQKMQVPEPVEPPPAPRRRRGPNKPKVKKPRRKYTRRVEARIR